MIVPMIIMPSRPMFTVPDRSAYRPPMPARAIGIASRKPSPMVPDDVSRSASAITRAVDMTASPRTASSTTRFRPSNH